MITAPTLQRACWGVTAGGEGICAAPDAGAGRSAGTAAVAAGGLGVCVR